MARRSKKDAKSLAQYRGWIDRSKSWRRTEGYDALWKDMIDLYRGRHFPAGASLEDRIAINLAFSTINVIFPSISVNYPKFNTYANRPEDEDRAVFVEAVLSYYWDHYGFQESFREAVKDSLVIGHGWLKMGWAYEEELDDEDAASPPSEPTDPMQSPQFLQAKAALDQAAQEDPVAAMDLPTDEELLEQMIAAGALDDDPAELAPAATRLRVTEDRPTVERVSPFDVFVDPEATSPSDMLWIAQRIVLPLRSVKADERYDPKVRKQLQADRTVRADDLDRRRADGDDIDRITVWEMYDLLSGTFCVFADSGDDFLIAPRPSPFSSGVPFEMVEGYRIPEHFYPMGDLEQIEGPQQELNKTRSQMMNHRKKYARKYLFRERAFGPEGRSGLESDVDNTLVPVVDENTPLQDLIIPVPITPLSADLYNYSSIIQGDIDKVSGVNEYARGNPEAIRRTATEASIIQDAANARANDKLAMIERFLGRVARKIHGTSMQFMTGEQWARIVGQQGQQFWLRYSHEDIKGNFDFKIEAGSTQPRNETFRRQQAIAMMQTLAPFVGSVIDPYALTRHILVEGFGVKAPEKFMVQQDQMPMGPEGPQEPGGVGGLQDPAEQNQIGPPEMDAGQGIPPEIQAQLSGQVGLNL